MLIGGNKTHLTAQNGMYVILELLKKHIKTKTKYKQIIGRRFSPGTPFSVTNKTDRHDITKIMLKVALNTIDQTYMTG
jgi:transcription initiation factor TFIID subunit TAF12